MWWAAKTLSVVCCDTACCIHFAQGRTDCARLPQANVEVNVLQHSSHPIPQSKLGRPPVRTDIGIFIVGNELNALGLNSEWLCLAAWWFLSVRSPGRSISLFGRHHLFYIHLIWVFFHVPKIMNMLSLFHTISKTSVQWGGGGAGLFWKCWAFTRTH